MFIDGYDKFLIDNGIIETYIKCDNPSGLRWNQKDKIKYTFPNGEEIILPFGPICIIDQVDDFIKYRKEIIGNKLKRLKLEKILKNIKKY